MSQGNKARSLNTLDIYICFQTHASDIIEVDRLRPTELAGLVGQTKAKTDHQLRVHLRLSPDSPFQA
jgi:hypothetical protein